MYHTMEQAPWKVTTEYEIVRSMNSTKIYEFTSMLGQASLLALLFAWLEGDGRQQLL